MAMSGTNVYSVVEDARKKSDGELYELIGRELVRGAAPGSESLVVRVSSWLAAKHDWIQKSICGVDAITAAVRSRDEQALSYAVAVALTPANNRDIVLYAWIAVLIVRIGIEKWCPNAGQEPK